MAMPIKSPQFYVPSEVVWIGESYSLPSKTSTYVCALMQVYWGIATNIIILINVYLPTILPIMLMFP